MIPPLPKSTSRAYRQLHSIYGQMRDRCEKPSHPQYKDYGARGISVCDKWKKFRPFLLDVWPRPEGMLLDRIDNNLGYSPQNCRWATRKEQNSNRRNCIYVELGGERMTLREACRRKGMKYRPIVKRIQNRGWDIERALNTPIGIGNTHVRTA